ncbi:MAG: oligopeptide ABC transporter ATP-binding protein [Anaerolineaceae bacterium]|jgi:peptide/nickel transport system ATP-binding protein|nr:ABC transporter ATP-binding protein [Anaerolineae bacterium]MBL1171980.1 ABC transporter ATP-binding protein [Chloroflexota bacterium]MBV6467545.1 Oligopeptide transport ATP-binding protein OppF [Anaerolineales bacterium]MDL1925568.1 ABC transporter ATP-binding protein [Anaerolineae bacterium AMX1]GER78586.1 oligopeptide ABC transporter ATP-binding protein [Candidatus Denitrolinea symbiosum]GJQ39756.1 MAG: oligopeptide ABC transporter ATP-binding protein [Anaerolineaceae bacterium]
MDVTSPVEKIENEAGRKAVLSIDDLHVWFELKRFGFGHAGYVKAVDGVTFNVLQGETIAVVGESGCGKSSLMKTILALYKPTKGSIIFNDKNLSELDGKGLHWYHSHVGYIQQDPYGALPPFMTVRRILEEPLLVGGVKDKEERRQRIHKAMDEVKLTPVDDFLEKYPHMLSGGQQQRVVIARAMIMEPKFLVADEPVSMLDASVRVEILKLLRALQEEHHLSVIYITHDLSTVSYFSERIFVMYAGNLVEKAKVRQALDNPLHPYTQALLTGTSEPDAKNAETFKELPPGEPPSLVNPPTGCRFHPRCSKIIKGLCEVEEPPDFEPEPGHLVACWLYK